MPTRTKPVYTPQSAQAALVLVRPIVRDLRAMLIDLREHVGSLRRLGKLRPEHSDAGLPESTREQLQQLRGLFAELDQLGLRLEDPELGLVGFPSEHDGRPATLCWKLGEDRVRYWYPYGGTYEDRKPLAAV